MSEKNLLAKQSRNTREQINLFHTFNNANAHDASRHGAHSHGPGKVMKYNEFQTV